MAVKCDFFRVNKEVRLFQLCRAPCKINHHIDLLWRLYGPCDCQHPCLDTVNKEFIKHLLDKQTGGKVHLGRCSHGISLFVLNTHNLVLPLTVNLGYPLQKRKLVGN